MGALKLECFTNDSTPISAGAPVLQDFDAIRKQAFEEGVRSGASAASAAFEAQKLRTLAPILEGLNDLAFAQGEARHAMLQSIRPLIEAMIATILPRAAKAGLAAEVSALVKDAASKISDTHVVITVAQSALDAVQKSLGECEATFTLSGDPDMDELSARVAWDSGLDRIDLSGAISRINDAVTQFYAIPDDLLNTGSTP